MGYYTEYSLEILTKEGLNAIKEILPSVFVKIKENSPEGYALDSDGYSLDACKWYSHEEWLAKASLLYPDVKFILSGEGEDKGDMWEVMYQNGKFLARRKPSLVWPDWPEGYGIPSQIIMG